MRRWQLDMEITPEGITANGVVLMGCYTMWKSDMRAPSLPGDKKHVVYRRDLTRRRLWECHGLKLPRGAKMGTKWTVVVEAVLWGANKSESVLDDNVEFDDDFYHAFFIDLNHDDIPVSPEHEVV